MSLRLVIACCYSSKRRSRAQPSRAASLWFVAVSGIMAMVIITGCGSVYHRTRNQLPPDPGGELNLRLTEAEAAAKRVERAGIALQKSLSEGKLRARIGTDFDRLTARVFDLERRVLAVGDTVAASGTGEQGETIERLAARADLWLAYVRDARPPDATERLRELEALLK